MNLLLGDRLGIVNDLLIIVRMIICCRGPSVTTRIETMYVS